MRPQHITAENPFPHGHDGDVAGRFNEAAAYHCGKRGKIGKKGKRRICFNEAAAYHCGKRDDRLEEWRAVPGASMRPQHITAENRRDDHGRRIGVLLASMRPQHITAENVPGPRVGRLGPGCFNEAAAYHCGKRRSRPRDTWPTRRLQ